MMSSTCPNYLMLYFNQNSIFQYAVTIYGGNELKVKQTARRYSRYLKLHILHLQYIGSYVTTTSALCNTLRSHMIRFFKELNNTVK